MNRSSLLLFHLVQPLKRFAFFRTFKLQSSFQSFLKRIWRALFVLERWNIGIGRLGDDSLDDIVKRSQLPAYTWLPCIHGSGYRADPFIWRAEDGLRVVYEEYPEWRSRAHIGSFPLEINGGTYRTEMSCAFHMSYPYIFREDETWLCVPESAEAGGVDLYQWDKSGLRWQLIQRLLHEPVLDPTLINHEGRWYMFGTLLNDGPHDKLRIWHSASLRGPWKRHCQDPAKVDICSSRSGGSFFRYRNGLFRPAQDCSSGYGLAVTVNRILSLSETNFIEVFQSRLGPDQSGPYPDGLHTFSISGDVFVIDGKRKVLHLLAFLIKFLWIIRHRLRLASRKNAKACDRTT